MRRQRRKINWFRMFLFLTVVFALLAGTGAGAFYAWKSYTGPSTTVVKNQRESAPIPVAEEKVNKRINILLLGVDDGDESSQNRRSDTMIVASIDPADSSVNLLSIPRDTKVSIPGRDGYDKITHAYAYGGASLAARTVQEFLHIPIHYYVSLDWQGFMSVIDILGGVDLYVEHNMKYRDPYAELDIELTKGYQHLDGNKAGQYVRFRHDELGDIGRVQRQQRLLTALSEQMFQLGTIFRLPALTTTLQKYVQTDMNMFTMLKIANSIKSEKSGVLQSEMLPGDFATIDGLSYWLPDKEQTRRVVERLFLPQSSKIGSTGTGASEVTTAAR